MGNMKVRKRAKIRNRYNQAPHLIQNTNGKVTSFVFEKKVASTKPQSGAWSWEGTTIICTNFIFIGLALSFFIYINLLVVVVVVGGGGGYQEDGLFLRVHVYTVSSIGPTLAFLTSLLIQDGGPHDFRSKMAVPTA